MYTALHFNAELNLNTPAHVLATLRFMLDETDGRPPPRVLDSHPLFSTDRWEHMFRSDSAYFMARTTAALFAEYGAWFINVTCNLKNYCNEIEKFLDWIDPYVEAEPGTFLGYSLYEEDTTPRLHFKKGSE